MGILLEEAKNPRLNWEYVIEIDGVMPFRIRVTPHVKHRHVLHFGQW